MIRKQIQSACAVRRKMICKVLHILRYINLRNKLYRQVGGRIKLQGNLNKIYFHKSFKCDGDLWLAVYDPIGSIIIDENVSASGPLIITAVDKVIVREGVLFGPNVMVTDHYHGNPKDPTTFHTAPSERRLHSNGPIQINNNVQIGANTCILSSSTIGEFSIVGANSVVKGEFPARAVLGGVPARIISKDVK
jgi:acetyltransferase-like isoleucine patch superfamily enzyme